MTNYFLKPANSRDRRKSVMMYLQKENSVEEDIKSLKAVMDAIMLDDPVNLDQCMKFKNLFKLDSGRRVMTFMLKEYSEMVSL